MTVPGVDDHRVRAAVSQLRTRLRELDLRCTQQRLTIVALLANEPEPGHLSAVQIHTRLTTAGHPLDISTVYRALATLVEIGVLHATVRPDASACYGIATTPHHHAICSRCGELGEIPAQPLTSALDEAAEVSRYQFAGHSLLLRGVCPECQRTDPTLSDDSGQPDEPDQRDASTQSTQNIGSSPSR